MSATAEASRADSAPAFVGEPWERQPKETAVAFDALRKYLEMGPQRSHAKLAHALGKTKSLVDGWSKRYRWRLRSAAWDNAQAAHADEQRGEVTADVVRRHGEQLRLHMEALSLPGLELMRRYQENPALMRSLGLGELVKLTHSAARAAAQVVPMQRLTHGLSTDAAGEPDPRAEMRERFQRMEPHELDAYLLGVEDGSRAAAPQPS